MGKHKENGEIKGSIFAIDNTQAETDMVMYQKAKEN